LLWRRVNILYREIGTCLFKKKTIERTEPTTQLPRNVAERLLMAIAMNCWQEKRSPCG
jgi:hypothetical protein